MLLRFAHRALLQIINFGGGGTARPTKSGFTQLDGQWLALRTGAWSSTDPCGSPALCVCVCAWAGAAAVDAVTSDTSSAMNAARRALMLILTSLRRLDRSVWIDRQSGPSELIGIRVFSGYGRMARRGVINQAEEVIADLVNAATAFVGQLSTFDEWTVLLVTFLSTGLGLAFTLVGIPILAASVALWRLFAMAERRISDALLDTDVPDPYRPSPQATWWRRGLDKLGGVVEFGEESV